ncbi:MAG: serine hydrolase domain-containing protein [Planctomycetaceae bacterium]
MPQLSAALSRRTFLAQSGALAIGAGFSSGLFSARSALSAEAAVDPGKLPAIQEFLDSELKKGSYPGAGIIASHNGKVFFESYVGTYHNLLGEDKPFGADVRSIFYSYTKGVSATIVMTAVQDGLIDLDTPVATYIPEFAKNGKDKITLRHLMTHSAGIPSAPSPFKPLRNEDEWKGAVQTVCDAKLEWAPGSQTAYHGSNMIIPAEVVRRKLDNKPWPQIARERLFDPIGAKGIAYALPEDKSLVSVAPEGVKSADGMHALVPGHPAGGCIGTISDGLRVLQLHLNHGTWEGKTVLKPAAWEEMHKVQYAKEIEAAGKTPKHEAWAIGWLTRGDGPARGGSGWFGFRDQKSPQIFGHAGIDTIIGVADPATNVALMFVTTRSPKSNEDATRLRNTATNLVMASVS